jgi:hypothetical protein
MRTDMVKHRDEVRLKRHGVSGYPEILRLGAFVTHVQRNDGTLKQLVRWHVVFDGEAEVDDALGHVYS